MVLEKADVEMDVTIRGPVGTGMSIAADGFDLDRRILRGRVCRVCGAVGAAPFCGGVVTSAKAGEE